MLYVDSTENKLARLIHFFSVVCLAFLYVPIQCIDQSRGNGDRISQHSCRMWRSGNFSVVDKSYKSDSTSTLPPSHWQ